jgi:hypothetical protein
MREARSWLRRAVAAGALLVAGCVGDTTVTDTGAEGALVLGDIEHTLVGPGGRHGTLQADSAVLDEALRTLRLIRPRLSLIATATRPVPVEVRADSGTLDIATGVVRLLRPGTVTGAPALIGRDTVVYDAAGDTLTAAARRIPDEGS